MLRAHTQAAHSFKHLRRSFVPSKSGKYAKRVSISHEDAVDLGYRLILGRTAGSSARREALATLASGHTNVLQLWADLASSDEFTSRVEHQLAIIAAAGPPPLAGLIDVAEMRNAKSVEQHNLAADEYFASRDRAIVEVMLAKPFSSPIETTELLTCFGHMVAGLRLLPGEKLLDFGAGTGWTSWNFAQLGAEVICSDVSAAALDYAHERFERWPLSPGRPQPTYLLFDGHHFDLPDESIDKACCFDAFHHLVNQDEVMAEFARVLKPGGLIGFDEPGLHHSKADQAQFEMREFGVVEGDIDLNDMAAMAARVGLEFVAADILTVRPIWADLDDFTDLVATRVPTRSMVNQLANQVHAKQLFILRKPGGASSDSRDRAAISAETNLIRVETQILDEGICVNAEIEIRNSGSARWLAIDVPVGGVALGARVLSPHPWETQSPYRRRPYACARPERRRLGSFHRSAGIGRSAAEHKSGRRVGFLV